MADSSSSLRSRLARGPGILLSVYATVASFSTYFCMYGFRKSFAAGTFESTDAELGSVKAKAVFVISQILGYTLSKYLGIRFLSELRPERRERTLVGAVLISELALMALPLLPGSSKLLALFFNGLPLGIVWGLVYSYLEGRRTSEILGAGLSCSFIVASGFAKWVGREILAWKVRVGVVETAPLIGELWMPAVAGALYLPFFLLSVWCLDQTPPPTQRDVAARVGRAPMNSTQRWDFVRGFAVGLALLFTLYFFLTAYRDYRDNYQVDIFQELKATLETEANSELDALRNRAESSSVAEARIDELQSRLAEIEATYDAKIFLRTETPIAFFVLIAMALLFLVRDNLRGFLLTHLLMLCGCLLIGVSTLLLDLRWIGGELWMMAIGLGLYLSYVPFGCILFDRLIAAMGTVATAVFAIYVADAIGYTGAVAVVLYKELFETGTPKLEFFRYFSYFTSVLCAACYLGSVVYFWGKRQR